MRKLQVLVGTAMFLVTNIFAIGSQHGVFRSQSTQGTPWQGTATITREHYYMTVYPDYLDVELEWTFTVGGTAPAAYQDALEIVGNLNLETNAVVVGMITWYKDMVLKGKLKTEEVAREQYENVVDRSSTRPQPPRDPVLLEYGWGRDNYDLSIFPVAFNSTRKIRFRYLVPAFSSTGVNKINFPNAFTDSATVSIKKGPGVTGFAIETGSTRKQFDLNTSLQLDAREYAFQAYGRNGGKSITAIVPLTGNATGKSTIYTAAFSTASMNGEMIHVTTLTPETALLKASVAEDYVILWRWNHPDILARYARQIVEQSLLLKNFLSTLDSAGKRTALIISKEGGETITFRLGKPGGQEFVRMVRYLDNLAKQTIIDPPMSSTQKVLNIQCDTSAMRREFESALRNAMALFEKNTSTLRHLLILTAGPQLVYSSVINQVFAWDSTIDVNLLTVYMSSKDPGANIAQTTAVQYWPGVDMAGFVSGHRANWTVTATIGNATDSTTIAVFSPPSANYASGPWSQTTDAHLYSAQPLKKELRWNIKLGNKPVASFTETPNIALMEEPMQYARLIGASHYLVPLARTMPSSMASTLGFIDEKYSLVALEQDALPALIAVLYDKAGVPLLDQSDIYPASTERSAIPVNEWLNAHPPESLSRNIYPGYAVNAGFPIFLISRDGGVAVDMIMFNDANSMKAVELDGNVPARVGLPMVAPLYFSSSTSYPDYSAAIAMVQNRPMAPAIHSLMPFVNNGSLTIDLRQTGIDKNSRISVVVYDFAGRVVFAWSSSTANTQGIFQLPCKTLARGAYILNICGGAVNYSGHLLVR